MDKFFYWSLSIKPSWVGFTVFISAFTFLLMLVFLTSYLLMALFGPSAYLIILAVGIVGYAWYIALFQQ